MVAVVNGGGGTIGGGDGYGQFLFLKKVKANPWRFHFFKNCSKCF